MGVAAQHRGNKVIAASAMADITAALRREEFSRAAQVAADCDAFYRAAVDYLVEPRGMRASTIERMRARRGWAPRNAALVAAHSAWVDADPLSMAGMIASVRRAQAAYALLTYALADWTVPAHITVPRAATT